MTKNRLLERVVIDPGIMAGKPVVKGTRVPVDLILKLMAEENTLEAILEDYPQLSREDILASLMYGAEIIAHEDIFPLIVGEEV